MGGIWLVKAFPSQWCRAFLESGQRRAHEKLTCLIGKKWQDHPILHREAFVELSESSHELIRTSVAVVKKVPQHGFDNIAVSENGDKSRGGVLHAIDAITNPEQKGGKRLGSLAVAVIGLTSFPECASRHTAIFLRLTPIMLGREKGELVDGPFDDRAFGKSLHCRTSSFRGPLVVRNDDQIRSRGNASGQFFSLSMSQIGEGNRVGHIRLFSCIAPAFGMPDQPNLSHFLIVSSIRNGSNGKSVASQAVAMFSRRLTSILRWSEGLPAVKTHPPFSVFLVLVAATVGSHAATLSLYNFTGNSDTPIVSPGAAGSDLMPSAGITGGPPTALFNGFTTTAPANTPPSNASAPIRYVRGTAGSADTQAALANGDYFSFTLAPTAGSILNLQSFTIDISVNGGTTNADTAEFALFASGDGFSAGDPSMADILAPAASVTAPDMNALPYSRYTVDLSSAAFQNLTGTVTFRLYVSNSASASVARFDDVTINGTVSAVPEPGGPLLLALGLCGVVGRRRRR